MEAATWRLAGLEIQLQGEMPGELADVIGPRLFQLGAKELWADVDFTHSAPQVALEALMATLLAFLSVRALVKELSNRQFLLTALVLFAAGLALRVGVPAVPMNNYADLLTPFESFRNDPNYRAPFYSVLWMVPLGPDAVFRANIVLGALAAPLFYLALDGAHSARRAVLPFAVAVAVLPLYVRLSASESPHVAATFVLALELLQVRQALNGDRIAPLGVAAAAALVGSTRVELVTAPLVGAFLIPLMGRSFREKQSLRCVAAITGGILYAALLSNLRTAGVPNFRPDLSLGMLARGLGEFVFGLPSVVLLRVRYMPLVLTLGAAFLLWRWIREKEWRLLGFFVVGTALLSAHSIAGAPAFSDLSQLIPYWSMSRYPSLWLLFPVFFAAWGVRELGVELLKRWRAEPSRMTGAIVTLLALGLLAEGARSYCSEVPYHAEYRFLRRFLSEHPAVHVAAGWRKNAGIDFCASLSLPYFGLAEFKPAFAVSDGQSPEAFLRLLPDGSFFFINALGQIAGTHTQIDLEPSLRRSIAGFRRLTCIARGAGERVAFENARDLQFVQWDYDGGGTSVDLEIVRLERPRIATAAATCPSIDAEADRLVATR